MIQFINYSDNAWKLQTKQPDSSKRTYKFHCHTKQYYLKHILRKPKFCKLGRRTQCYIVQNFNFMPKQDYFSQSKELHITINFWKKIKICSWFAEI